MAAGSSLQVRAVGFANRTCHSDMPSRISWLRAAAAAKTMSSSSSFAGREYDAVVVGSGPNGLAAAITIAQAGRSVLLIEGKETLGGGTRSAELTLPGFLHDVCSCVYPMAVWSPFFRSLPLKERGLEWVQPAAPLAHPLDDGSAVILERSVEATAENLGEDRERYVRLLSALLSAWPKLESSVQRPFSFPAHPLAAARFGWTVFRSASNAAEHFFRGARARALFAGLAAHAVLPLEQVPSAAFGFVLQIIAHAQGWPFARGGSQQIANASGGAPGGAGRRDRYWDADRGYRATSARARDFVRRNAEATSATGGFATAARVSRRTPALSVWAGRLQVRLGAGRADSMEGGGMRPRGDGSPGRHVRGDCRIGARPLAGKTFRAAFRAAGAADAFRSHPRAGGKARGLGVLSRAQRIRRGYDRGGGKTDRTIRAGISQADPEKKRARGGQPGKL